MTAGHLCQLPQVEGVNPVLSPLLLNTPNYQFMHVVFAVGGEPQNLIESTYSEKNYARISSLFFCQYIYILFNSICQGLSEVPFHASVLSSLLLLQWRCLIQEDPWIWLTVVKLTAHVQAAFLGSGWHRYAKEESCVEPVRRPIVSADHEPLHST